MDQKFGGYQPNLDSMQSYLKENEKKQEKDTVTWWNIPAGLSVVRIMPPWDATGRVALPVYHHPIEFQSPEMKYKKYNWTCSLTTFGKPCPICEVLTELRSAGVDVQAWESGRRQFYYNAIVMHDPVHAQGLAQGQPPEKAGGVAPGTLVIMKSPKVIYDWVISQITNPMVGDITSIENGIDIYITKEGTGLNTKYTPTLSPDGRKPVPKEYLDKIDALYNLDDVFGAGFDETAMAKLTDHLRRSASAISNSVGNTVATMGGYAQPVPPQPMYQQPPMTYQQPGVAPSPFAQNVAPAMLVAPSPVTPASFQQPMTPTEPSVAPPPSVAPTDATVPECFGNYNAASVSCVVCPSEIACQRDTNK
jgi:hypothetical protein